MPGQYNGTGSTPTVVVQADDPLIRDGALAFLRVSKSVVLLSEDLLPKADIGLIICGTVTSRTLSAMATVAHATSRRARIVLVADSITEAQLAVAVNHGLSSFLVRNSAGFEQILNAALQSHQGHSALPSRLTRTLLDRMREMQTSQTFGAFPLDLAPREVEVLRLLSDGMEIQEIAAKLNYSERHIKGIIHTAVKRLGLRNRVQAVAHAIRAGIL